MPTQGTRKLRSERIYRRFSTGHGGEDGQGSWRLVCQNSLPQEAKLRDETKEEEKAIGHFNFGRVLSSIIREFQLGVYSIYQDRSVHQSPALRALQHYRATISLIRLGLPGWFFHGRED